MARGLYADTKILELGSGAAGPVASRYFAEQGARIIRIESRKRPDFLRTLFRAPEGSGGLDASPMFVRLNADKQSLALDLSHARAREIALRLVDWADVVLENFAPGVMQRFGLDWESLRERKPELVMVSGCLFGQTGPQRSYPGFGGQGSAIAGFNHLTGWPDREPHGPYGTITDSLSPRYMALAVAAALLERQRSGRGRHVDLSQIETGVYSLSEWVVRESATGTSPSRCGNRDEGAVPHGVFPCAHGPRGEERWVAIAVWSDAEWQALCGVLGDPPTLRRSGFGTSEGRRSREDELEELLAACTRAHEAAALMAALQDAGVEAGVVQDSQDLLADPQLEHRGHFRWTEHPHLGRIPLERVGFRFSEAPGRVERPGPGLGEHNALVLGELLGLSPDEIEELEREGVVA